MTARNTLLYQIPAVDLMKLFRYPDQETQEMLTELGLKYLDNQAAAVDTRIRRREDRLASVYGDDVQRIASDELLAVYRQEHDLIQSLMGVSREKPFVQVGQERLNQSRQHLRQLKGRGWKRDDTYRIARYHTHVEQSILTNLLQGWHVWLRSYAAAQRPSNYSQR